MDFVFGFPPDTEGRDGIVVFVDRLSKMVHMAPVSQSVTAEETAVLFLDCVFRHHGMPETIVSDRDPRFTALFWRALFKLLGTKLPMSTAAHPQTDGQTERVNRVLEDVLRSYATSFSSWSSFLPLVEFALNSSVHASHGLTPFYVNYGRHPRIPASLSQSGVSTLSGGGTQSAPASRVSEDGNTSYETIDEQQKETQTLSVPSMNPPRRSKRLAERQAADGSAAHVISEELSVPAKGISEDMTEVIRGVTVHSHSSERSQEQFNFEAAPPLSALSTRERKSIDDFVTKRQCIIRFARDALAEAVDTQKEQADRHGRSNRERFKVGERVLLSTDNLPTTAVTNLGSKKLAPRYVGPFRVTAARGDAYTLDIPSRMKLHPTFYVGRLKRYCQHDPDDDACSDPPRAADAIRETRCERQCETAEETRGSARATVRSHSTGRSGLPSQRQSPAHYQSCCQRPESGSPRSDPNDATSRRARARQCFDSPRDGSAVGVAREHEHSRDLRATARSQAARATDSPVARSGNYRYAPHGDHARASDSTDALDSSRRAYAHRTDSDHQVPSSAHSCAERRGSPPADATARLHHEPWCRSQRAQSTASSGCGQKDRATRFVRDGPPPLVDSSGDRRWVVDRIVGHADRVGHRTDARPRAAAGNHRRNGTKSRDGTVRHYRVRWLGFPSDYDTWEPAATLREDVPDIVDAYERNQHRACRPTHRA